MTSPFDETLKRFADALAELDQTHYELTLFVIGASDLSARAIDNVRQLCERYLAGRYHLEIVDMLDTPAEMISAGVIATPTLVKNRPLPVRRLVGDLSHTDRVMLALEIPMSSTTPLGGSAVK